MEKRYFKDADGRAAVIDNAGDPARIEAIIKSNGLTEITEDEYREIITPTQEELDALELARAIRDAKAYLAETDYKDLPNYVPKPDEDLAAIIAERNEKREFIRANTAGDD